MSGPTRANKTGKATSSDTVATPQKTAEWIVNHFAPSGLSLDPCAGGNVFYDLLPYPKHRCEIKDGIDFFNFDERVDWIITNPPYSIYDAFLQHAFEISENVVFFVPIAKAFKSMKIEKMVLAYGGLKEIVFMGGGGRHGFAFGFPVGCLYYKKGYKGSCKITHKME